MYILMRENNARKYLRRLTARIRLVLQKLIKKFLTFYGTRRFSSAFIFFPVVSQINPVLALPTDFFQIHYVFPFIRLRKYQNFAERSLVSYLEILHSGDLTSLQLSL
jgi:hypothetical protein